MLYTKILAVENAKKREQIRKERESNHFKREGKSERELIQERIDRLSKLIDTAG